MIGAYCRRLDTLAPLTDQIRPPPACRYQEGKSPGKGTPPGYLSQVLTNGDSDELIRAVSHVARAHGMARIAKDSGLGRARLYKALTPGAKPRFETIMSIMRAAGIALQPRVITPSR